MSNAQARSYKNYLYMLTFAQKLLAFSFANFELIFPKVCFIDLCCFCTEVFNFYLSK